MTPKPPSVDSIPKIIPEIIFFDIDDTLSREGILAKNNQLMLEQLVSTDIKLVIATGRSKAMLPPDILALYAAGVFDAIICTNGQYSFNKNGVISHYPLSAEQAEVIHTLCQANSLAHKFDSATHIAWAKDTKLTEDFCKINPFSLIDPDYYKSHPVYQASVVFKSATDTMQQVDFAKYGLKLVHWHHIGGDVLPIEASKARAIKDVCQYFNIDVGDTMAFGDGFNDFEMFDLVGYAVAMGDAQPALIAHADYVTGTIEQNGIQMVLEHLGFI